MKIYTKQIKPGVFNYFIDDKIVCQNEFEHAVRALRLGEMFSMSTLAEFLHQQYRAAAKAMARAHGLPKNPALHDHGFGDCYGAKKQYFLRRASWLLDPKGTQNGWHK